jgi:1-pyrroline-5-carboxylate dehydrogenase
MDAVTHPPMPVNEPVLDYAPGSAERAALVTALGAVQGPVELGAIIGGVSVRPAGKAFEVRAPFDHHRILASSANCTQPEAT